MKVTHNYGPQTRPSSQGLAYLDVNYNPNQFGAALGVALRGFGEAQEAAQKRRVENQRFSTLTDFSEFETAAKLEIDKLKQDTPEDAANFFDQAESTFDRAQSAFLNRVPAELQPEFEYRAAQVKQDVIFDAFKFDFEQQNLFFNNQIAAEVNAARVRLAQNPNTLKAERQRVNDFILSSGLPEIEKAKQLRLANAGLEMITYKSKLKEVRTRQLASPTSIANRNLPPQAAGILSAISKRESGGKYDIRYDGGAGAKITSFIDHPRVFSPTSGGSKSSAAGKYQFISSTWDAAAAATGVKDFSPESQDTAAWYWAQKTYADVSGHRKSLTQAIEEKDWSSIRRALGTQWEGVKHMSDAEFEQAFNAGAGQYGEYSSVLNDPQFSNISFSDRQTLENDAFTEADTEYNAILKQQRALEEARINELYVGLMDGTKGSTDINALRDQGILRDYDDINKAFKIIEDRQKDGRAFYEGETKLTNGGLWVFNDPADRERADAIFGEQGATQLQAMSQDYVQQTLLPRWEKMQMAAPDMANILLAMSRNANAQQAAFAFETMRQMRERLPEAFGTAFNEDVQKKIDFWEIRRNYYNPDELVGQIQNRGVDQATRQVQSILRADGQELAKELTVEDIQPLYESIIPWQSADIPITPRGKALIEKEFRALYTDAYVQTGGNVDEAKALAEKQIARVWTLSTIGGSARIARFPPEVAGYKKHNGGYEWIDKAVRRELGLGRTQQFELIADEETELEIMKRGQAANAPDAKEVRPSYLIAIKEDNGTIRLATNPQSGRPLRIDFVVDKDTLAEEDAAWRQAQEEADKEAIKRRFYRAKELEGAAKLVPPEFLQNAEKLGIQVDPNLEEEYNRIREEEKQRGTSEYLQELKDLGTHLRSFPIQPSEMK